MLLRCHQRLYRRTCLASSEARHSILWKWLPPPLRSPPEGEPLGWGTLRAMGRAASVAPSGERNNHILVCPDLQVLTLALGLGDCAQALQSVAHGMGEHDEYDMKALFCSILQHLHKPENHSGVRRDACTAWRLPRRSSSGAHGRTWRWVAAAPSQYSSANLSDANTATTRSLGKRPPCYGPSSVIFSQ